MNSTSTSPPNIGGINIVFAVVTFFLSLCLYSSIGTGSLLLSYWQGENLIQGELVQNIQAAGGVEAIHKIEFSEYGDKNYYYQCYSKPFSKRIGSSLYFYITKEGVLLRELVLSNLFIFICSSFLTLVLLVLFILMGIGICSEQSVSRILSMSSQIKLFVLRFMLIALGIGGLVLSANRMQEDFLLLKTK